MKVDILCFKKKNNLLPIYKLISFFNLFTC